MSAPTLAAGVCSRPIWNTTALWQSGAAKNAALLSAKNVASKIGAELSEKRRIEERKESAIGLKSKGVPIEDIVDVMKLTPDEIAAFGLNRN